MKYARDIVLYLGIGLGLSYIPSGTHDFLLGAGRLLLLMALAELVTEHIHHPKP